VGVKSPLINYAKKGFVSNLKDKETVEGEGYFKVNLFTKEVEIESYFIDN
jgi:hypothetical protein